MIPLLIVLIALAVAGPRKPAELPPGELPPGTTLPPPPPDTGDPCQIDHRDGPYRICLWRSPVTNRWRWRAEQVDLFPWTGNPPPDLLEDQETYATSDDALIHAWMRLRDIPIGDRVISGTRKALGLQLQSSGLVTVLSLPHYVNVAQPIIVKGEADADAGVIAQTVAYAAIGLEILTTIFGHGWNPYRVRIAAGGFGDAVQRLRDAPKNPPHQARAFMGM